MSVNSTLTKDLPEVPFAHLENIDANPELQEKFGENRENFDKNYRNKLQSHLGTEGEDLLGKISGKFEQNGNINESINYAVDTVNKLDKTDFVKESLLLLITSNEELDQDFEDTESVDSINFTEPTEREIRLNNQEGLIKDSEKQLESQLSFDSKKLGERLSNVADNKNQAKELVYNEDFIEPFLGTESSEIQENKDFFQCEEVQGDLDDILGKFVLNTDASSIDNVYQEGGEKGVEQINESLNCAFNMKLGEVCDGKMNYSQEAFDKGLKKLHDGDPFIKIEAFEELKGLVNNPEGRGGARQSKDFKNKAVNNKLKLGLTEERFNEVKELLTQANDKSIASFNDQQKILDEIKILEGKDNENNGDIIGEVGDFEISGDVSDKKEATT